MTTFTATLSAAHTRARHAGARPQDLNPIYRAILRGDDAAAPEAAGDAQEGASEPDQSSLVLARRQLCAPAVLALGVTDGESIDTLRIGIHADDATLEQHSREDESSRWEEADRAELMQRIAGLLPAHSPLSAPARLTVERRGSAAAARGHDGAAAAQWRDGAAADRRRGGDGGPGQGAGDVLRLTATDLAVAREHLAAGAGPEEAFAALERLDPRLRDAFSASGPRASASMTLHDPGGRATERPVTWSRLWTVGQLGMYRTDTSDNSGFEIVVVEPGDLLGTLLPVLEEGFRFAAAAGGERR